MARHPRSLELTVRAPARTWGIGRLLDEVPAAAGRLAGALLAAGLLAASSSGCGPAADDAGFGGVQDRGAVAMGVDQYTSAHVFQPLPDGGRIVLQRDTADAAGTATIRDHMRHIAARFAEGDFRLPGFVHARAVPGTAVMAARRRAITYVADTLPRGGEVRIRSADPEAVRAIHEFLAFQRTDHRASAGGHSGHGGP